MAFRGEPHGVSICLADQDKLHTLKSLAVIKKRARIKQNKKQKINPNIFTPLTATMASAIMYNAGVLSSRQSDSEVTPVGVLIWMFLNRIFKEAFRGNNCAGGYFTWSDEKGLKAALTYLRSKGFRPCGHFFENTTPHEWELPGYSHIKNFAGWRGNIHWDFWGPKEWNTFMQAHSETLHMEFESDGEKDEPDELQALKQRVEQLEEQLKFAPGIGEEYHKAKRNWDSNVQKQETK